MKILLAVVVFLVLAFAWIQFYPLQDSARVNPEDQGQTMTDGNQQVQGNKEGQALTGHQMDQARKASGSQNSVAKYQPPPSQRTAQAVRKYEKTTHSLDSGSPSSRASYNSTRQNHARSYSNNQQDLASRQAYADNHSRQGTGNRQPVPSYKRSPATPVGSHGEFVGNEHTRGTSQGRQTTTAYPGSVSYNASPNAPVGNQGYQNTPSGSQTSGLARSQQYRSQVASEASTYRKEGEPVNCTYKDNQVYCR